MLVLYNNAIIGISVHLRIPQQSFLRALAIRGCLAGETVYQFRFFGMASSHIVCLASMD